MDTKELMIGDFVLVCVKGKAPSTAQIFSIERDGQVMTDVGKFTAGEIEPIILTDDMLNQIAEYHDYRDFWTLKGKGGQFLLDANQRTDGTYYMLYTDDEALWRGDYFACCMYVHELQNILRATGHVGFDEQS